MGMNRDQDSVTSGDVATAVPHAVRRWVGIVVPVIDSPRDHRAGRGPGSWGPDVLHATGIVLDNHLPAETLSLFWRAAPTVPRTAAFFPRRRLFTLGAEGDWC